MNGKFRCNNESPEIINAFFLCRKDYPCYYKKEKLCL